MIGSDEWSTSGNRLQRQLGLERHEREREIGRDGAKRGHVVCLKIYVWKWRYLNYNF